MDEENKLIKIFEKANTTFLRNNSDLLLSQVSERTLCGALMMHLRDSIQDTEFSKYNVDVEYNRNKNSTVETKIKSIPGPGGTKVKINCDLILHSRGQNLKKDNLIAIEMKKSSRSKSEKDSDRIRIMALTQDRYGGGRSLDNTVSFEHVCDYTLGIYYEVNYKRKSILVEYYRKGYIFNKKVLQNCWST
ncbi:hypothetical protein [Saccharibacillus endophyticus]|uniref:Uncharacterized protein n=1 Tax=Saccharibacillus endophyticus TaxID=2060666 RepID=A0ABQ2A660_9BACL|nr:hypothetical protein [Saccharibacillus endophyticus]GGH84754.1 hypothetical protein GCM10007362_40560 [Saccharibacillus endophyticus]